MDFLSGLGLQDCLSSARLDWSGWLVREESYSLKTDALRPLKIIIHSILFHYAFITVC